MKLIDLKKYVTNKVLVVGVIALLIGGSFYSITNMRAKLSAVRSELSSVKLDKSIVEAEKHRLDSLIIAYNASIKDRDAVISKQDLELTQQDREIAILKSEIWEDLRDAQQVPASKSYGYINQRFKPVTDLNFKFDSTQVKNIHYALVERDGLFDLNTKYTNSIKDYQKSSLLKDKQIKDLKDLNITYLRKSEIYRKENAAYEIRIEGLNKQVKQQKFMKNVGIGATVGLVTYIIINSIAN